MRITQLVKRVVGVGFVSLLLGLTFVAQAYFAECDYGTPCETDAINLPPILEQRLINLEALLVRTAALRQEQLADNARYQAFLEAEQAQHTNAYAVAFVSTGEFTLPGHPAAVAITECDIIGEPCRIFRFVSDMSFDEFIARLTFQLDSIHEVRREQLAENERYQTWLLTRSPANRIDTAAWRADEAAGYSSLPLDFANWPRAPRVSASEAPVNSRPLFNPYEQYPIE